MQLRDARPDIWYPGCWGCFGGAVDAGEDALATLRRELAEELELHTFETRPISRLDFDFGPLGLGKAFRAYYLVELPVQALAGLVLHEGQRMEALTYEQLVSGIPVVPYDAFALHIVHSRVGYNAGLAKSKI